MIKWLTKFQTSKVITWYLLFFYVIQVGVTMFSPIKFGIDISGILMYTTPLITLVLGSYFLKSYQEKLNLPIDTTTTETITNMIDDIPKQIITTTEVNNTNSNVDTNSQG